LDTVTIAELAEVNPAVDLRALSPESMVSFIPMSDVTESGLWVYRQERKLNDIRSGYTPFAEGDLLFAKITPCMENGKGAHAVGLTNSVGFGSTEFHVLRARGDNSPRFLFHWLQSQSTRTRALAYMGGSAGQQRVQPDFFTNYRVKAIAPPEQVQIAAVLDTMDEAIAKTEAVIAKLRHVYAGLLNDLMTRGLDENGELRDCVSHPERFQDTPVGHIPKEWEVCLLDDVAIRGSGHTPSKDFPAYWNGGIKWVSLADSEKLDRIYISATDKEISELGIENSSAMKHPAGTVILSRDAGIGKSAILAEEMAVSQHFMAWRCEKRLHNVFLYYWLQHNKPRFEAIAMGSTIKTIGLRYFKRLKIAIPPIEEQGNAADALLASEEASSAEDFELKKLHQLKSGLMNDLLTGRVRVPESIGAGA
jgi:type I restriction enzyme S subunit